MHDSQILHEPSSQLLLGSAAQSYAIKTPKPHLYGMLTAFTGGMSLGHSDEEWALDEIWIRKLVYTLPAQSLWTQHSTSPNLFLEIWDQ